MLKVLAAVLAVLSAAISITIYTATLPALEKQATDNAAAIETLGGSISDNAEAIENIHYYRHNVHVGSFYCDIYNRRPNAFNNNTLIDYIQNYGGNTPLYTRYGSDSISTETFNINAFLVVANSRLSCVSYNLDISTNTWVIRYTEIFSNITDLVTEL